MIPFVTRIQLSQEKYSGVSNLKRDQSYGPYQHVDHSLRQVKQLKSPVIYWL